ncbi:UV-damage endonuclease [Penicillium digitatum]|uniref:MARVEL domain-containing protein n=3 Tax=Penicillium digitatum TaxID=36651 RepID=K9GTK1_PEND2|nr:hypothetical protein PDIP_39230 [Penicillium digitatum Pd1]EKV15848.1 hypothetical protein PDIP_39230 [Penicillium digitatum Pd1]EKV17913.1 hypothetical protein PDIG_13010 [Penicillium digitatum PHI26]QQK42288.1 UV-damage endonuclease [Penicillium digitatum]
MGAGGVILRFFNLGLRVLQFLDAAVILGIFSYFLAVLTRNDQTIVTWIKAVEGLAGAATAYSLLGIILSCCLGGVAFFAFLGVALDICFVGAMVAIAILTRDSVGKCTGIVDTPMGTGNANYDTASKNLKFGMACKLEKVVFAVAVIGIFFYLTSILFQILLARHHKREKRFGPSPTNGYTHGSRKAFWRRNKNIPEATGGADTLPGHPTPQELEMGAEPNTEKGWFSSWGKNQNAANAPVAIPAAGSYGYRSSAYTGNI